MENEPSQVGQVSPGDEPFPVRLRQAIKASELSLQTIVHELRQRNTPVTIATLSYWQSGRSRPERAKSLEALAELENVLNLPSGELSSRLPQRKPRGRYAKTTPEIDDARIFTPEFEVASELMSRLNAPWNDGLERLSIHDRIHVDRLKRARRLEYRLVMRASRDGVSEMVSVYAPDESVSCEPIVAPLSNCSLGRVERNDDPSLILSELKFPRTLRKDEIIMIEYEVRTPTGGTSISGESRSFRYPAREYVFETVFDPRTVPVRVQAIVAKDPLGMDFTPLHEVTLHDGVAQLLVIDVQPGHYGMRYAWTEEEAKGWDE